MTNGMNVNIVIFKMKIDVPAKMGALMLIAGSVSNESEQNLLH